MFNVGIVPLPLETRYRLARDPVNLQSANDALGIVEIYALGGYRVNLRQFLIKFRQTLRLCPLMQLGPYLFIASRPLEKAVQQRLYIQSRPADRDNLFPPPLYLLHRTQGPLAKRPRTKRITRLYNIDKMILDTPVCLLRRLGRTDIHPAIDLHRVNADYFSIQTFRQIKS